MGIISVRSHPTPVEIDHAGGREGVEFGGDARHSGSKDPCYEESSQPDRKLGKYKARDNVVHVG